MIKRDKAFEVENGVVFDEDGPGIFAEPTLPPVDGEEQTGDRLFTNNGDLHRFEGEWVADFNFSQDTIPASLKVKVTANEQMVVRNRIHVAGFLRVDGQVFVENKIELPPPQILPGNNFSFYRVLSGERIIVPTWQEMALSSFARIDGFLEVQGKMSVLSKPAPEVIAKRLPKIVELNKAYNVLRFEEYQFRGWLKVFGQYKNEGFVYIN